MRFDVRFVIFVLNRLVRYRSSNLIDNLLLMRFDVRFVIFVLNRLVRYSPEVAAGGVSERYVVCLYWAIVTIRYPT